MNKEIHVSLDIFREIVRQRGFHPLLPRHRVYLFAPHKSDAPGKRFARLFVETWKQIPLGPRRAILRHWRNGGVAPFSVGIPLAFSPLIELLSGWSKQEVRRGGHGLRGTKAMVSYRGHKLQFWSKIVAVYPDSLVRDLIAHELAHVLQSARGWDSWPADPVAEEEDADFQMQVWGFDDVAMDEWDRTHGVTRIIKIDPDTLKGKRAWARAINDFFRKGR